MSNSDLHSEADPPSPTMPNPERGIDFLLSEIETARAFMTYEVSASDKRTDLLLTIASAVGGGLVILSQTQIGPTDFLYIALIVSIAFLVVAVPNYLAVLRSDVSAVGHIRAINLIRQYFAEKYIYIKPALLMSRDPRHPSFGRVGGNRSIQTAIISLSGALATGAVVLLLRERTSLDALTIQVAAATFVVTFLIFEGITRIYYRVAERKIERADSEGSI